MPYSVFDGQVLVIFPSTLGIETEKIMGQAAQAEKYRAPSLCILQKGWRIRDCSRSIGDGGPSDLGSGTPGKHYGFASDSSCLKIFEMFIRTVQWWILAITTKSTLDPVATFD